jgi:hypothetical protein
VADETADPNVNDLSASNKHPAGCNCKCHQMKLFTDNEGLANTNQSTNETTDQSTSKRAINSYFLDINNNNKVIISQSNSNTTTCSMCNRKIAGPGEPSADGINLNDSTIFYSSVGVQGLGKSNFEDPNNHDFYCYSAKDAVALFDELGEHDGDDEEAGGQQRNADDDDDERADLMSGGDVNVNDVDAAMALKRKRRQEARALARARRRSIQTHTQICCYTCCFCCSRKLEKTKCCMFLDKCNKLLRRFVDCSFFQRTILCAILINTICMGIEHHQQVNISRPKFSFKVLIPLKQKITIHNLLSPKC